MKQITELYREKIETALGALIPADRSVVCDAMQYSLCAGGKRIRPALVLEFCRVCGGVPETALPYACALEMIHTYSLIHDDLPCMDDDDLRRGRPSCHKQFGEANALLAGDALLTHAFYVLLGASLPAEHNVRAGRLLAQLAGFDGMIGGQVMDLENETRQIDADRLQKTDACKTGALIQAACRLGCIAAGADETKEQAAALYAQKIGLAFQIVDDILDVTADEQQLGKPVGSDDAQGKQTYVTLYGLRKAKDTAAALTEEAKAALRVFGGEAENLLALADNLLERKF